MDEVIEIRIRMHVKDYLTKQMKKLDGKQDFSEIIVNPFFLALMKNQLKIDTKKKLAEHLIFQGVTKGLATSFGCKLQKIAEEFTHEPPRKGFHLKICKNNKKYNVLVVSGLQHNTANVEKYRSKMEKIRKDYPRESPIFGICYGNQNVLKQNTFGKMLRKGLEGEKIIIGREFWEFISGNKKCRNELLKIIKNEAEEFSKSRNNQSINKVLLTKSREMEKYLSKRYDEGNPKKFWENFFRDIYI
jgi:hypothetical protein